MLDILSDFCEKSIPASSSSGSPLGNIYEIASDPEGKTLNRRFLFELQKVARDVIPDKRLRCCCLVPLREWLDVMKSKKGHGSIINGLVYCGKGWVCPVCGQKLAVGRAAEVKQGIDTFVARSPRNLVLMLTLTQSHSKNGKLDVQLSRRSAAIEDLWRNYEFKQILKRLRVVGKIHSFECKYGLNNGWHPHSHILLFCGEYGELDKQACVKLWGDLEKEIAPLWVKVCKDNNLVADAAHGVDVCGGSEASDYINKLAMEMTLGGLTKNCKDKSIKSYSVFQLYNYILSTSENEHKWAVKVVREFYRAIKGKHAVKWSKGLKNWLCIPDKKDKEIVEKIDDDLVNMLKILSDDYYRVVRGNERLPFQIREQADMGLAELKSFLDFFDIKYKTEYKEDLRVFKVDVPKDETKDLRSEIVDEIRGKYGKGKNTGSEERAREKNSGYSARYDGKSVFGLCVGKWGAENEQTKRKTFLHIV